MGRRVKAEVAANRARNAGGSRQNREGTDLKSGVNRMSDVVVCDGIDDQNPNIRVKKCGHGTVCNRV